MEDTLISITPTILDGVAQPEAATFMSVGEAASFLGVTRPMISRWLSDGTLASSRDPVSHQVLIARQEIEALLRRVAEVDTIPRPAKWW